MKDSKPEIQAAREYAIKAIEEAGIDISQWTKTVEDLAKELLYGESFLIRGLNDRLIRQLRIVLAEITYVSPTGKVYRLKEDRQVFASGQIRQRPELEDFSVSEKIMTHESPITAIIRCIKEELGVSDGYKITKAYEEQEATRPSTSYQGLASRYVKNIFHIVFSDEAYNPDGYLEVQPGKTTYFVWKEQA